MHKSLILSSLACAAGLLVSIVPAQACGGRNQPPCSIFQKPNTGIKIAPGAAAGQLRPNAPALNPAQFNGAGIVATCTGCFRPR